LGEKVIGDASFLQNPSPSKEADRNGNAMDLELEKKGKPHPFSQKSIVTP